MHNIHFSFIHKSPRWAQPPRPSAGKWVNCDPSIGAQDRAGQDAGPGPDKPGDSMKPTHSTSAKRARPTRSTCPGSPHWREGKERWREPAATIWLPPVLGMLPGLGVRILSRGWWRSPVKTWDAASLAQTQFTPMTHSNGNWEDQEGRWNICYCRRAIYFKEFVRVPLKNCNFPFEFRWTQLLPEWKKRGEIQGLKKTANVWVSFPRKPGTRWVGGADLGWLGSVVVYLPRSTPAPSQQEYRSPEWHLMCTSSFYKHLHKKMDTPYMFIGTKKDRMLCC